MTTYLYGASPSDSVETEGIILQCEMDDSAFSCRHRFEFDGFAGSSCFACESVCEGFQGVLAAFSVVFHVKHDEVVVTEGFASSKVCQVLKRIQCLAVFADEDAEAFSVEGEEDSVFVHHFFHGDVEVHALEYVFEEFLRFFSGLFLFFRIERGFFFAFFVSRFFFVFLGFCFFRFLGFFSGFSRSFCSFFGSFLAGSSLVSSAFGASAGVSSAFGASGVSSASGSSTADTSTTASFLVDQSEKSAGGLFYDMNDCFFTADSQLFYAVFYCGFNCFCCDSDCSDFVSSASRVSYRCSFYLLLPDLLRELSFLLFFLFRSVCLRSYFSLFFAFSFFGCFRFFLLDYLFDDSFANDLFLLRFFGLDFIFVFMVMDCQYAFFGNAETVEPFLHNT